MQSSLSEKDIVMHYVLNAIPELPVLTTDIIPEVRLAISDFGGRNIDDDEAIKLFERMQTHSLISQDGEFIRRIAPTIDPQQLQMLIMMMQQQKMNI